MLPEYLQMLLAEETCPVIGSEHFDLYDNSIDTFMFRTATTSDGLNHF